MIVAVDFDGTIVDHDYPRIGADIGAFPWLREIQKHAKLILWTMRDGPKLQAAVDVCRENGVEFWGVNCNPEQHTWTNSPKALADVYVDDAALGVPLTRLRSAPGGFRDRSRAFDCAPSRRPFVDWSIVGPRLLNKVLP
jgi:hypothetical protein